MCLQEVSWRNKNILLFWHAEEGVSSWWGNLLTLCRFSKQAFQPTTCLVQPVTVLHGQNFPHDAVLSVRRCISDCGTPNDPKFS